MNGSNNRLLIGALIAIIAGLIVGLVIVSGDDGGGSDTVTIDSVTGGVGINTVPTDTEPSTTQQSPTNTGGSPGTGGTTVPGPGL
ncbi:MAG: hypothetical protein ACXWDT_07955 [Solirubrobacterales bacterium]